MAFEYKMPKFGLTMEEGTITRWFKNIGDKIEKGEDLLEIETDKITNVESAPESGVILHIAYAEGDTAPCMDVLAVIGKEGEVYEIGSSSKEEDALVKEEKKQFVEQVVTTVKDVSTSDSGDKFASPLAKRLAKEGCIDINVVSGSGPNGRVIERDIINFKMSPLAKRMVEDMDVKEVDLEKIKPGQRIMSEDIKTILEGKTFVESSGVRAPIKGMRKVISDRMSKSWQIYPMVTLDMDVDMTEAKLIKSKIVEGGTKLSYTEIIVKACAVSLTEFKSVNSSLIDGFIYEHEIVNIGVAVSLDDGLVVPVVKNAQNKSIGQIGSEIRGLSVKAREGKLSPDMMSGGTFTVSNLGGYKVTHFTPIINYPEAAILGVCAIKDSVMAVDGKIAIKPIMRLCLTFDHRLVDGAQAAQFLTKVVSLIENPLLLL